MGADRARAIAIVEHSRETHVEWLEYQQKEPRWREWVATQPASIGEPDHHRQCIRDYDVVLRVLRGE